MATTKKRERSTPSKKTSKEEGRDVKLSTYPVNLTRFELIHLRDMFSVKLPPSMDVTLSEALAESQRRPLVETKLWQKLARACTKAGVPIEDEAPDFTILPSAPCPLGVYQVEADDDQIEDALGQLPGLVEDDDGECDQTDGEE